MPQPAQEVSTEPQAVQKTHVKKKFSRLLPSFVKPSKEEDRNTAARTLDQENTVPPMAPVKRNPNALGTAEAKDVLFEVISIKGKEYEV